MFLFATVQVPDAIILYNDVLIHNRSMYRCHNVTFPNSCVHFYWRVCMWFIFACSIKSDYTDHGCQATIVNYWMSCFISKQASTVFNDNVKLHIFTTDSENLNASGDNCSFQQSRTNPHDFPIHKRNLTFSVQFLQTTYKWERQDCYTLARIVKRPRMLWS